MNYEDLSKQQLVNLLDEIDRVLNKPARLQSRSKQRDASRNGLENLIGTIPFLLLNPKYFERNYEIAEFAASLGIHIPSPEKKKREDMIGRIVSAIATFDRNMIEKLNAALSSVKRSGSYGNKTSFFFEWEKAIRSMKL
jgi:hypothetical protein